MLQANVTVYPVGGDGISSPAYLRAITSPLALVDDDVWHIRCHVAVHAVGLEIGIHSFAQP